MRETELAAAGQGHRLGAMVLSAVERYLWLGLRLGRHVEGIVDAYYGPPELAAAVEAEPLVDPRALVFDAELLLDELEDGWLRDQVVGLRTYAGVLAGESRSYSDAVDGRAGRAAGRRRGRLGGRAGQAVAGVLRVPRRPAQPRRCQRRSLDVGRRAAPSHEPRDVSRSPRRALRQRPPARTRPRAAGGDARAGADATIARIGGDRRARAHRVARGGRGRGVCGGPAGCPHRTPPPPRPPRRAGPRAVPVGRGQRGIVAVRGRIERGRDARIPRAVGPDDPGARDPFGPLPRRADLADLRDELSGGARALPLVRGGRPAAFPPPADRAGARPRAARARGRASTDVIRPMSATARPPCRPGQERRRWRRGARSRVKVGVV